MEPESAAHIEELKLIGHPARYALRQANTLLREVYSKATALRCARQYAKPRFVSSGKAQQSSAQWPELKLAREKKNGQPLQLRELPPREEGAGVARGHEF